MRLGALDWAIVAASLLLCFVPALFFGRRAGRSTSEFFASGRVGAVVAGRPVDGRDDVQQRHAEPGHRHRPARTASPATGCGGRSC